MEDRYLTLNYAKALFQIAASADLFEEFDIQLSMLLNILQKNPLIFKIIASATISRKEKKALLEKLLAKAWVCEDVKAFIFLLSARKQLHLLGDIIKVYQDLSLYERKTIKVKVASAVSLSEKEKARLRQRLSEMLDKKVQIIAQIQPDILGGFRLKIGSLLLDYSLRLNLERITQAEVN